MPIQPQPGYAGEKTSPVWKYMALGCGGLLLLFVIIGLVTCVAVYIKGADVMVGVLRENRAELYNQLTDDHSQAQRERFEEDFETFLDEFEQAGLIKFMEFFEEEFRELQLIMTDKIITVDESQRWCDNFEESYNLFQGSGRD
jgi:hypothetical protein